MGRAASTRRLGPPKANWAVATWRRLRHQPPTSPHQSQVEGQDDQEHPASDQHPPNMEVIENNGHLGQSVQPLIERVAPHLDKLDESKPEEITPKEVRQAHMSPIVTWLSPIDAQAIESTILASRASAFSNATTPRLALLPQAWASGRTQSPVLWAHGLPKTGKTTYTASVARHLLDTAGPRDGVAAVYCSEKGPTAHALLSSICAQLAAQVEQLPGLLTKLHAELPSEQRPDIDAITLVMLALCDGFNRVFVCVDALDELDREGERPVLLQRLQWMRNRGVRLLVSSQTHGDRPERCRCNEDIEAAIEGADEMLIEAAEDDIRQSVMARLHAIPDQTKLLASAGEDPDAVVEDAMRGCEGSFELAHLYLDRRIRELQSLNTSEVTMTDERETKPLFYARALVDNSPSYVGGLPFRKGDIIAVTRVEHENSWKGRLRGMVGSFARVHAEKVDNPFAGARLLDGLHRRGMLRLREIMLGNPRRRDFAMAILCWVAHARQPFYAVDMVQVLRLTVRGDPEYRIWLQNTGVFIEGCDGEPVDWTWPEAAGPPAGAVEITKIVAPLIQTNAEDGTLSLHQWEPSANELRAFFPEAHLTMAARCLQALIMNLDDQANKPRPKPMLGRPRLPFLTYAEDNWGYHASLCQTSSLDALILEYLAKAYKSPPSWIEKRQPFFRDAYHVLVTDNETPLLKAARHGLNDVLTVLLEGRNCDVNAVSYQNETALVVAITAGFPSTAHLLYRYGASIHYRNQYGESLIHMAAARNDGIMVALLISCGLDPDTKCAGHRSYTALHSAIVGQCLDAARMLVGRGTEVTGESMDEAAESGNLDMVKLLVKSRDSLLYKGSLVIY
ncbi:hypothetical protein FALCPG4_018623 [Fusarium falciforme]